MSSPIAIGTMAGPGKLSWAEIVEVDCGSTFNSSVRESIMNTSQSLTK